MGKTRFKKEVIRKMLSLHPHLNVYHLDTKKRGDYSLADGTVVSSDMPPDPYTTPGNRVVWQPYSDNRKAYDKFFKSILDAGLPAIVDIDESINMRFGQEIPRELSILIAQGRLPGIHIIGGTQEIARAPRQMLSQATYLVSFSLLNDYDRSTMAGYLGIKKEALKLKKYAFYFMNTDLEAPVKKYNTYQDVLSLIH